MFIYHKGNKQGRINIVASVAYATGPALTGAPRCKKSSIFQAGDFL